MNPSEQLNLWHKLIEPNTSQAEKDHDYSKMLRDEIEELQEAKEFPSVVKEAVDVMVTARAVRLFHSDKYQQSLANEIYYAMTNILADAGVSAMAALSHVNESNFSKLILEDEVQAAKEHFDELGIEVDVLPLEQGFFGAYSSRNQVVKGKEYPKNKLLKAHTYKPVNESVNWWTL